MAKWTREELENEATISVVIEDEVTPVRGNYMASGDEDADRALEDEIIERLERGDTWAWCSVQVKATVEIDGEEHEGESAWLGNCSYKNERDFRESVGTCTHPDGTVTPSGYFLDLRAEALDALFAALPEAPDPMLYVELDVETMDGEEPRTEHCEPGTEVTVRIVNPDGEDGTNESKGQPLWWFNSARMTADPKEDAIHFSVSIDDPRGAMGFTVRRLSDGRIVVHCPYPADTMPHVNVAPLHEGTLVVVDRSGKPRTF